MSVPSSIGQLFVEIENLLSRFYGFQISASAIDHLLAHEDSSPFRASVLFHYDHKDDALDIGLSVAPSLLKILEEDCPLNRLHDGNLDAFFVIAEEISHFHLLINRADSRQPVSQLELEWQGEIDKVLVGACFLYHQSNDPHWRALLHKLFNESKILDLHSHRYQEASRLAGRFWIDVLQANLCGKYDPLFSHQLKTLLRQKYWETWQAKVSHIMDERKFRRIS